MEITVHISDLNTDVLSARTLALASEFALVLYTTTGKIIDVESNDVLEHIFAHAKNSDNNRLKSIYLQIREDLGASIVHCVHKGDSSLFRRPPHTAGALEA